MVQCFPSPSVALLTMTMNSRRVKLDETISSIPYFLVAALDGALALIQIDGIAKGISQKLKKMDNKIARH